MSLSHHNSRMACLLGSLVVLMGGFTGSGTTAFTLAPSFHQPRHPTPPSSIHASARGFAAIVPHHGHSSVSRFNSYRDTTATLMLSDDHGAKDAARTRGLANRLFGRGGGAGAGASGGLEGLDSGGGSSGPPRSGGLGRGGGGGGGGRGDDSGDDRPDMRGDMVGFGAAQVMMLASDEGSSPPESTLRGGYRRRSMYGRRLAQRSRGSTSNGITATNVLIALNAIVYAFQTRYPGITKAGWKLAPAITQQGQWYRLLTPVVLHGSFTHLAVNSMSFSSVGPVVERVLGKKKFVAVYALAGIAGNVLSCVVNPRTPAVGASGAIFGMVGAWGAFCLMNEAVLGRNNSQRALRNIAQTVMINVVYGMSSSQIDNMGHLGGFLGGAAVTFLIGPRLRRRQNPLTGEPYIVDESFKLALPRLGRKAPGSPRYERRWP